MTTSEKVRAKGFKSLKELAEQEDWNPDTLSRWDKNNPDFFDQFLDAAFKRRKL